MAIALASGVATTWCTSARADGYVEFYAQGFSGPNSVSALSQLPDKADVTGQTYSVTATPGGPTTQVTITDGYTLAAVIAAFGDSSQAFGYAAIRGTNGWEVLVPRAEALSGAAGGPVLWADASGMHFADGTPTHYVTGTSNEIYVSLEQGSILSVTASTTTKGKITAGQAVQFEVDAPVTGQAAGETLSYRWLFDDGNTGSGSSVSHKYLVAGTYDAYLEVTGSDNSVGYSPLIAIAVGTTPKGPNRAGGGTSKKKDAPTHGPGVKGGQTHHTSNPGQTGTVGANGASSAPTANKPTAATTPAAVITPTVVTTTAVASRARPPIVRRTRQDPGQPLTGIPLTGAMSTPAATRRAGSATTRPGVSDPARTGHLTAASGVGEYLWIVLAAAAMALGGALLESKASRLGRRRWTMLGGAG